MILQEMVPQGSRRGAIPQAARGLREQVRSGSVHFCLLPRPRPRADRLSGQDAGEFQDMLSTL